MLQGIWPLGWHWPAEMGREVILHWEGLEGRVLELSKSGLWPLDRTVLIPPPPHTTDVSMFT